VPNRIITNNGSQFTSGLFWEYYASANIKICFAFVAYPRSNGQVEHANTEVLKGLKTKSDMGTKEEVKPNFRTPPR
jgi:hypothetical protein